MDSFLIKRENAHKIFAQYYCAMSYYFAIAILRKGKDNPEDVYHAILERINNSSEVIKKSLGQFTYEDFLQNWQAVYDLWQANQPDDINELYGVSRFESKILYQLLISQEIFYNFDHCEHALDKKCYQIAWENIQSLLKDLGLQMEAARD